MNTAELKKCLEYGILDEASITTRMEEMEKRRILQRHEYKIWQSGDYWYTYLHIDNRRKLIKKRHKEDLEDVLVDFYINSSDWTLRQIFDNWIELKKSYGEIQLQTVVRYENDFARYFGKIEDRRMSSLDDTDLEDYIKRMVNTDHLKQKAWLNFKTLMKGMWKYAYKRGFTTIRINDFIDELEISRKKFNNEKPSDDSQVFTLNEEQLILNKIKTSKPSLVNYGVELIFLTGVRAGELSTLKFEDFHDNVLTVSRREVRYKLHRDDKKYVYEIKDHTKGRDGIRNVILPNEALEVVNKIKELNPDSEYLFISNGKWIKANAFTDQVYKLCEETNIPKRSAHKIRKTYGTKLLDAGLPEKVVISQMGHTDIMITRNHYYFNRFDMSETREMIDNVFDYGKGTATLK